LGGSINAVEDLFLLKGRKWAHERLFDTLSPDLEFDFYLLCF
jgi:hypothetical protein